MSPSGGAHLSREIFIPLNVFAGPFLRTDQAPPPQRSRNFANGADPGDYGRKIVLIVRTVLLEIMKIDLRAPARTFERNVTRPAQFLVYAFNKAKLR